jgi:hypothetical protein
MEAIPCELFVFANVEAVKACRTVGDVLLDIIGFDEQSRSEDLLSEIAFVQLTIEHDFV